MIVIFLLVCLPACIATPVRKKCSGSSCVIPLMNHMKAALFADLDMSQITSGLTDLIQTEMNNRTVEIIEEMKTFIKQEMSNNVNEEIKRQTQTMISDLKLEVNARIDDISKLWNRSVALTSCVPLDKTVSGTITFPTTKTNIGITNLAEFQSTGIFKCEVQGLYLFSAFIATDGSKGYMHYQMRKNSQIISLVMVAGDHKTHSTYHSGSGQVLVELVKGDTLDVFLSGTEQVEGGVLSCVTIVKLS